MATARWRTWLITLALGTAAGFAAVWLHLPVPWMVGPLLAIAALRMAGAPLAAPHGARNFGQWVIGTSLGLYFTPPVVDELLRLAPAVVAGAVVTLLLGAASGRLLARLTGVDAATAHFASLPGGASEMVLLAERCGGRVDRVAAAQTLRVVLVVLSIPALFTAIDVHGSDGRGLATHPIDLVGLAALAPLTLLGVFAWRRLGPPTPWVIGPLLVAAALTASGIELSGLPPALRAAGQIGIAVSLGCRFSPTFFRAAPRFLAAVSALTFGLIAVTAVSGALLAWLAGLPAAAVILGMAPGGIAEMCITAQTLHLGVPLVTSFQVLRMLTVVLVGAPLFRWFARPSGPD